MLFPEGNLEINLEITEIFNKNYDVTSTWFPASKRTFYAIRTQDIDQVTQNLVTVNL